MCDLNRQDQRDVSLGIIRPRKVLDFVYKETEREWKPKWQATLRQLHLFGPQKKPLEKIPYKFSYKFICEEPDCLGHHIMTEDWEAGVLFLQMRDKYGDEQIACEKVKEKAFGQICAPGNDVHFFMGTILHHGTWIIGGLFYPKNETMDLF
jgi:hypothetical protein